MFRFTLILLATAAGSLAQLDRNAEQCAEAFGPALASGPLPEYNRYARATYSSHAHGDYQILLTMERGVCVQITYRRPTPGAETFEKLTRTEMNTFLEQNSRGDNWFSSPTEVNFWLTPRAIGYYEPGLRQFTILTKGWAGTVDAVLNEADVKAAAPPTPWTEYFLQTPAKP